MRNKTIISSLGLSVFLISIITILSIVYASFTSRLDINGYVSMNKGVWDVHFENLSSVILTGKAEEVVSPTLHDNATSISDFNFKFYSYLDSFSYLFDVVNDGNIDAKISSITIPKPICKGRGETSLEDAALVCNNLIYRLTYDNGEIINIGDELNSQDVKKLKLTLLYNGETLPQNTVDISGLGITIIYSQK